ncbi:MAG: putative dehydrogenase [Planctomycetota bacterium]|jgi:predicted dehydrogenase
MLRMAVVGVGWAGSRQVEAIGELGRKVEVDCLVDPDANFLREKSVELEIEKTYTSFDEVLRDNAINAVSICSPHPFHCAQAIAAAEAGKHVLVEKPMAMDVAEATRMLAAADAHGVRLYVAENASYVPLAERLRQIVQEGEFIGELLSASIVKGFRSQQYGYEGRRAWLAEPEKGGKGTWTLHGIHTVGQMRYVLGEVQTVYMREHKGTAYKRTDVEGTMSGTLTLTSGVHVSLVQTAEIKLYGDLGGYVLHGDRGSVRAGEESFRVFNDEFAGLEMAYPEQELSSYAQELEAFADYVLEGVEGATTGQMERRSLAIVEAGYESAATGLPVDLKERFGAI